MPHAAALGRWIGRIRARGVTLPLYVGLAGPAERTSTAICDQGTPSTRCEVVDPASNALAAHLDGVTGDGQPTPGGAIVVTMYRDNSLIPSEAVRLCALGTLAGLIEKNHPGQEKRPRQMTMNSDLIYDVLRRYEPDHLLLRAAWDDARSRMTELGRLARLVDRGLTNYWGYNTVGFFAPHAAYSAAVRAGQPGGQVAEFQAPGPFVVAAATPSACQ